MRSEIDRARRVARADATPWERAWHDADDLMRNTYEPLLDVLRQVNDLRALISSCEDSQQGFRVHIEHHRWGALKAARDRALSALRESLPEEGEE